MAEDQKRMEEVLRWFEYLKKRRSMWEKVWVEIAEHVLPKVTNFDSSRKTEPWERSKGVFSGKPRNLIRIGSYGYQGYLTPRSGVWFGLEPENPKLMDSHEVRVWFQEVNERMLSALSTSNFYDILGQAYEHGLTIGTSTVTVENDERYNRCDYEAIHPKQVYIAEDEHGTVDTHFREFFLTGRQLRSRFGDEKLPKQVLERIDRNPYEEFRVLHAVYPRQDRDPEKIDVYNKPWASVYILLEPRVLLRESGYDFPHIFTWRHTKNSDEEYGTSPSWDALVDILRANQMAKAALMAAQHSYNPPIAYSSHLAPYLDLLPGGRIPLSDPSIDVIKRIDVLGNYQITLEIEKQLNEQIREHYMVDFFLMLSQSDRTKTALEASEIAGEKAALLSAVVGKIESELLDPLLTTTFWIELEAGRIPPPPDILLESGETGVKINYIGPLAMLQKRHYGQQSTIQALSQAAPIFNIFPEAKDFIDGDKLVKKILAQSGFDQSVVRTDRAVQELRMQRFQQMMAAQQQAALETLLKNVKGLNAPVQSGSPLETMMKTMEGPNVGA